MRISRKGRKGRKDKENEDEENGESARMRGCGFSRVCFAGGVNHCTRHSRRQAFPPLLFLFRHENETAPNHRTKPCQITEQDHVKSPNVIDLRLQEVIRYAT